MIQHDSCPLSKAPKGAIVTCIGFLPSTNDTSLELEKYGVLIGDSIEVEGIVGNCIILIHQQSQLIALSLDFASYILVAKT